MNQKHILLVAGLLLAMLGAGIMIAQDTKDTKDTKEKKEKDPAREADKEAIDKSLKESLKAFNDRDAAAIAANWTAEGEYIRNDGEPIRGREEIQKGYADYFKTLKGKPKLEAQVD